MPILENGDDDDDDAMIVRNDETGKQNPLAQFFRNFYFVSRGDIFKICI